MHFNINLLNCESLSSNANFLDLLGSYQILPHIILPTRITDRSSTLIDNIFMSSNPYECLSGNLSISVSDHLPQFLIVKLFEPLKHGKDAILQRKWSKFDKDSFTIDFLNKKWDSILNLDIANASDSLSSFFKVLSDLIDRYVPTVQLSKKQLKLRSKPWITSGILSSIRVRDRLLKSVIKTKTKTNRESFYAKYKVYRNRIVSLCQQSKKSYYSNYFYTNSNNIKKIWEGIRELTTSSSYNKKPITLQLDDSISSDPGVVSETFNNFFINIADKIKANIPFSRFNFSKYLKNSNPKSFFVSSTSPTEIALIIDSLNNNKSSGPNSIPVCILKLIKHDISSILSKLVNISFSTGVFPSILKEAKVIPVFKKGSPLLVQNYRPISLLSNIDKIYQKLMYNRIISFLNKYNCLYSLQFGFRKNHSSIDAIINYIETTLKSLDSGDFVCGIFIDFQKAFDTVDHDILLHKLKSYGIRGIAHHWFKSFLSSRTQYVAISGHNSSLKLISNGVPQGSVLGPLLFLLYINDLNNAIQYSTISHFGG